VVTSLPALQNRLIKKLVVISSNIEVKGKDNLVFMANWQLFCGFFTTIFGLEMAKNNPGRQMDKLIIGIDKALRVVTGIASAARPNPGAKAEENILDPSARRHSAGLMRVNHVGEVCAQALYDAQGRFSKNNDLRQKFAQAAREEEDHLAWTAQRLNELGSRPSVLNPLWYAGAYMLGTAAAQLGDARSLGFVAETERQVETHLASHLQALPLQDKKSRAIVEQMRLDEMAHGAAAQSMGAAQMPVSIQKVMAAMAKVMTTTAYYV
jgi:ubiquinone biosynthesis monooxygenase Coq7